MTLEEMFEEILNKVNLARLQDVGISDPEKIILHAYRNEDGFRRVEAEMTVKLRVS